MTAYVAIDLVVSEPATIAEYEIRMAELAPRFGARILARELSATTLDGDWSPQFFVLLEFPSKDRILEFYASAEYEPLKAMRQSAARSQVIAVSRVDEHT